MKKSSWIAVIVGLGLFLWLLVCAGALAGYYYWNKSEASPSTAKTPSGFEVKFGILSTDASGNYYVSNETTALPLTYRNGFVYGVSITPPDDKPYSYKLVHRYESIPKTISYEGYVKVDTTTFVRIRSVQTKGKHVENYVFNAGEAPGAKSIEVYINDQLVQTIYFTATAQK